MRISWLLPLLTLASPIFAVPADPVPKAESENTGPKPTKFNGIEVPPLRELNGPTLDEDIKQGYW
jgi:hypothetical protein